MSVDSYISRIHYASIDPPENLFFADQTEEGQKLVETGLQGEFPSLVIELVKGYLRSLPTKRCLYRYDANDFGIQIDRLRLGPSADLGNEMHGIAKRLGFSLDIATTCYYPRDHLIRFEGELQKTGRRLFVGYPVSDAMKPAMLMATNPALGRATSALTKHPAFQKCSGSAYRTPVPGLSDYITMYGDVMPLPLYVEGGNFFVITNPRNPARKMCLIGEDSFRINLLYQRRHKAIDETSSFFRKTVQKFSDSLTETNIFDVAKEMYLLGLVKPKNEQLPQVDVINDPRIGTIEKNVLDEYVEALRVSIRHDECVGTFTIDKAKKQQARGWAARYLAQREATKAKFASLFKTGTADSAPLAEDTIIVPLLGYHLDMFLRPGPGGTILLQDYALCCDLLKQIRQNAVRLGLTAKDLALLDIYQTTAEQLRTELEPFAAEVRNALKAAGLTVIPTPALFYGSNEEMINVNFMNGVSGWSPKTKRYYYLVTGVTIGDFLGGVLMIMFEKFMKVHAKDTDVIYVGGRPNPEAIFGADFSVISSWTSEHHSGLHCLTIETEVSSHLC